MSTSRVPPADRQADDGRSSDEAAPRQPQVVPGSPSDIATLVRLHVRAFPDASMTRLGTRFLECYYRSVMSYCPSWVGLVRGEDGEAIASTMQFGNPPAFQAYLRRRTPALAASLLPTIVRSPSKLKLALNRAGGKPTVAFDERTVESASTCVDPDHHGRGLGTLVLERRLMVAVASGYEQLVFTTNDEASGLPDYFRARGYEVMEQFTFDGRTMHLMGCDLRGLRPTLGEPDRP